MVSGKNFEIGKIYKKGFFYCALQQKILNGLLKIRQAVDFAKNMIYNKYENSLRIVWGNAIPHSVRSIFVYEFRFISGTKPFITK